MYRSYLCLLPYLLVWNMAKTLSFTQQPLNYILSPQRGYKQDFNFKNSFYTPRNSKVSLLMPLKNNRDGTSEIIFENSNTSSYIQPPLIQTRKDSAHKSGIPNNKSLQIYKEVKPFNLVPYPLRHFKSLLKSPFKNSFVVKSRNLYKLSSKRIVQFFHTPFHPILQSAIATKFYFLHILVFSKSTLRFPFQLLPNSIGLFQSVGLDTLFGAISLSLLPYFKNTTSIPWKAPINKGKRIMTVVSLLTVAYVLSGYANLFSETFLLLLTATGVPISIAMHRSLQILTSHLMWVWTGSLLLENGLHPFFDSWYKLSWRENWVWWSICGFYGSHFLFTLTALVNQFVVPLVIKIEPSETIVNQMIQPENNDVLALFVGALAPCASAPWWEEVLYRGFTLPSLSLIFPVWLAKPFSALLFAAHHLNLYNFLPLTVLGYAWAELYSHSHNLLVPILIHAMWNSRIFLGSLLGQ